MRKEDLRVSDEAVENATGRTWDEWVAYLDERYAASLDHKEIVSLLAPNVESAWWQQMVANSYEKLKGARKTGETQAGTFEIGVQRTVPVRYDEAWSVLTSRAGQAAWLGDGADLQFEEGETYELADGSTGEVRVVVDNQHLRITYSPPKWERPSTIQLRVIAKGDRTTISFHEENLPQQDDRERRRRHYETAVKQIKQLLG